MAIRRTHIFDDVSPRLRPGINRYVGALQEKTSDTRFPALHGKALQGLKGRWLEHFAGRCPQGSKPEKLLLEIGMHKGLSLLAMAAEQPEWAFVGMDITFKRVVVTAERIEAAGSTRICSVLGDARQSSELFAPGELAGVVVFFPDPWSKKKSQIHNRLLSPEVCQNLTTLIAPGGFFWLKTDCQSYFGDVSRYFSAHPLFVASSDVPFQLAGHQTTFESKFLRLGLPIYSGVWRKTRDEALIQEKL